MKKYIIAIDTDAMELSITVNKWMVKGYIPQGGISSSMISVGNNPAFLHAQAMVYKPNG